MEPPFIHISWLELKPNETHGSNFEDFEEYYPRIINKGRYNHIPKSVFKQWIHPLHSDWETLFNYSWLNYINISFESTEWTFANLKKINVINRAKDLCNLRGSYDDFEHFFCTKEDNKHWKNEGTWKTPPIILDNKSISNEIPEWSEINGSYQLVEGHSRFGYLHSMKKISDLNKGQIAENHKIWLMKVNSL